MDLYHRLKELVRVAEQIGLTIRRAPMGGEGGGYCVIKGQRCLFIDIQADLQTRYERTIMALAPLAEIDTQALDPEVQDDMNRLRTADNHESSPHREKNT